MPVTTHDSPEPDVSRHEVIYSGEERRAGTDRRRTPVPVHEAKLTTATLTGGSSLELIGGGVAVVLAIIGLAGYLSVYMAAISTIAIGGALLAHGGAASARWSDAIRQAATDRTERIELGGGIGSEVFGGAAGIVLGILALAEVRPLVLLPVAAIVLGGAILLGAPAQPDLARLAPDRNPRIGRLTYEAVEASTGAMVLVGLAAIVLGILAVIDVGPVVTLVTVSTLAIGGALLVTGSALTARFARRLQQIA